MNRENKKNHIKKVIINHTLATKVLSARYAADLLYLTVREATIAIIALTACQVNILILSPAIVRQIAEELWNLSQYGFAKRRMGDYSPLQNLRNIKLKQNCR